MINLQVARTLRPGGIFINLMTKKYLEVVDKLFFLEPLMQKMEKEGIWSKIEIYCDSEEKQGIYHIYKKIQLQIVNTSTQGILTKEYQKRSKNSVSAYVVAFLAVVTLIKDCYKIQKSHSKQTIFSHFIGPTGLFNTKVL